MPDDKAAVIRAAGGVLLRRRTGEVEIALVHRPRYDDWSLPKGKLEPGESEFAAAVREVGEETGARVAVSRRLTRIGYDVGSARKTVAFWLMRQLSGDFTPNDEVDALEWLSLERAADRLTYDVERDVLADLDGPPLPDSVVVLVRHAKAGKRSEWRGPDSARPLERTGLAQAQRLRDFLRPFAPDQVLSAAPARCVETVRPLADALGLDVVIEPAFTDDDFETSPHLTEAALHALAKPGRVTVVSSQGTTIPGLVEQVVPRLSSADTRKGAAWVLTFADGTIVSADYYDDAAR